MAPYRLMMIATFLRDHRRRLWPRNRRAVAVANAARCTPVRDTEADLRAFHEPEIRPRQSCTGNPRILMLTTAWHYALRVAGRLLSSSPPAYSS